MEESHKLDLSFFNEAEPFFRRFNQQSNLILEILTEVANDFPQDFLVSVFPHSKGSKISKGNQLDGLPYQVLDIVRDFNQDSGFNIRLLNWWGKGFFIFISIGNKKIQSYPEDWVNSHQVYQLSVGESIFDYGEIIQSSLPLTKNNLKSTIKDSSQIQIWQKLDMEADINSMRQKLSLLVKSILEYHTSFFQNSHI